MTVAYRNQLRVAGVTLGVLLLCGACGGGTSQTGPSAPTGTTSAGPASTGTSQGGSTAADLAGRIGTCTGVVPLSWPGLAQAAPALASAKWPTHPAESIAICRIEGHPLVVFSVSTIHEQAALEGLLSSRVGSYSAGPGWVAASGVDLGQTPESSLVQVAAQDLGGSVIAGAAGR